jgi:hypothetical protein
MQAIFLSFFKMALKDLKEGFLGEGCPPLVGKFPPFVFAVVETALLFD